MLSALIDDLIAAGLTEKGIADEIGLSQPSVHRIRKGQQKNVNFTAVDALRRLHATKIARGGEVVEGEAA